MKVEIDGYFLNIMYFISLGNTKDISTKIRNEARISLSLLPEIPTRFFMELES